MPPPLRETGVGTPHPAVTLGSTYAREKGFSKEDIVCGAIGYHRKMAVKARVSS